MRVTILGCGGSSGTPSVDWGWGRCDPSNPRNRRTRPSIIVEEGETRLLVDTSPDLREQFLRENIREIDAVLYTHAHADHLHGIDDLRPINRAMDAPLPIYANRETLHQIQDRFGYVFEPLAEGAKMYYKPVLIPNCVEDGNEIAIGDVFVQSFEQDHGFCDSLGFRFGPIAYTSDAVALGPEAFRILKGVEVWIIGTLTDSPHPTHADVGKALRWLDRIGATRGILTHLSGRLDYAELSARLPAGVEPAFDGMVIEVPSSNLLIG